MQPTEQFMLEALRDWFGVRQAHDAGAATKGAVGYMENKLIEACTEHCHENEGEFPVTEAE